MTQIVECVPNFSEGRDMKIVDEIEAAIAAYDVRILDRTSDVDHNRSVITFAGGIEPVMKAAFSAIATASRLIDLTQHAGVHPRIGAADVVPFVPIEGVTMADCVRMAQVVGQRVGDELRLPVYLYESAATRPERRNLADIRRIGYDGLKMAIMTDPLYTPDYGPAQVGSAGAVVIGARQPLIAYNVFLETDDVEIARIIAHEIRESSGGLPAVKALGLLVNGQAQVSMNLVDYRVTPPHVAFDAIVAAAQRFGVRVARSELIGLMPEDAVLAAARHYLKLPELTASRVIESAINRAFKSTDN